MKIHCGTPALALPGPPHALAVSESRAGHSNPRAPDHQTTRESTLGAGNRWRTSSIKSRVSESRRLADDERRGLSRRPRALRPRSETVGMIALDKRYSLLTRKGRRRAVPPLRRTHRDCPPMIRASSARRFFWKSRGSRNAPVATRALRLPPQSATCSPLVNSSCRKRTMGRQRTTPTGRRNE